MRARAALVAEVDGQGITRLTRIRSDPPLVLRATPDAVYLVGGAGGPLGGDDLALDITVGPDAMLIVRSAAASIAQPGPGTSVVEVTATVGTGGRLDWKPEPTVAVRGCRHHMRTTLLVGAGATVMWREEIVLGRHGETSGSVVSSLVADLDGRPLLRHRLAVGLDHPATSGPAVLGQAGAVGSVLMVDPHWMLQGPESTHPGPTAALLRLDGPAVQILALAADARGLRRDLDDGIALCDAHTAGRAAS